MKTIITTCLLLFVAFVQAQKLLPGVPLKDVNGALISEQQFREAVTSGKYKYQSLRNADEQVLEYQLLLKEPPVIFETKKDTTPSIPVSTSVAPSANVIPTIVFPTTGNKTNDTLSNSGTIILEKTPASVKQNSSIRMATPLEPFDLTDLAGNRYSSESLKGKVVVLNFWFAECRPCIDEAPELNEVVAKYKDNKDVVILSPTFDGAEKVAIFLQKVTLKTIICAKSKVYTDKLELSYYPTSIVVGKNGYIYNSYTGSVPGIKNSLVADIDAALAK